MPVIRIMILVNLWLNKIPAMIIVKKTGLSHLTVKRYKVKCEKIIYSSLEEEDQLLRE